MSQISNSDESNQRLMSRSAQFSPRPPWPRRGSPGGSLNSKTQSSLVPARPSSAGTCRVSYFAARRAGPQSGQLLKNHAEGQEGHDVHLS